ncbi:MAG TPA: RDD family protein [Solirubrobacteraceae bacterium]|nr:RDD family protein [Solirubrobacteraceae bacterium]
MSISAEVKPVVSQAPDALAVPAGGVRYVGLSTRAIAFAVDAALIDVVAVIVALGAALILSVLHIPGGVRTALLALGAFVYVAWCIAYFVGFWSATGQTPGCRVMQIRVVGSTGDPLRPPRAFVRCIGLVLAAIPLFAGYLPILFDAQRRGLQDYLAHSTVVEASQ